jgi:hypothetical protein
MCENRKIYGKRRGAFAGYAGGHVLPMADFACGFDMVKGHNAQKVLVQP